MRARSAALVGLAVAGYVFASACVFGGGDGGPTPVVSIDSSGSPLLVGTPTQIVDELDVLCRMGVDGCLMSWVNYKDELAQWIDQVLPLMEQAGQRGRVSVAA